MRSFVAALVVGSFFVGLNNIPARGDLVISGFHGVRIYDERTGGFVRRTGFSEEQEGIAFGKDGRLYVLMNDMGGGWIARYAPVSYDPEGSFGPHDFTAMPLGMCFGPDGNFYVGGNDGLGMKGGIRRIDGKTGADLGVFVAPGEGGSGAFDVVFGPDGNLYLSNWGGSKIPRFNGTSGAYLDDFVTEGSGGLEGSSGMVFGPDGNLYVSSGTTHRVLRYDGRTGASLGDFITAEAGGLKYPAGLAFGPDGSLYVCSGEKHEVLRYDGKSGAFIDVFIAAGSGGLDNGPNYIAFSPRLPTISISRTEEGTVVKWPETGLKCVLETASALGGVWEIVTNSPSGSGGYSIRLESEQADQQRFFRLRQTQ